MYVYCKFCEDGNVERFLLDTKTGKTRYVLLPCARCDGSSDMEQGIRRDEVFISEEEFERLRTANVRKAA
jgi:hypothetical protein